VRTFWLVVVVAEIAFALFGTAVFLVRFGDPRRNAYPTMAWYIVLAAWAHAIELAALLLLGVGVTLPVPVFALVYALITGSVWYRLALMLIRNDFGPVRAPR
jgi:hypothetical protein